MLSSSCSFGRITFTWYGIRSSTACLYLRQSHFLLFLYLGSNQLQRIEFQVFIENKYQIETYRMVGEFILLFASIALFVSWSLTHGRKSPKNLPPGKMSLTLQQTLLQSIENIILIIVLGPTRLQVIINQSKAIIQKIPPYKLYVNLSQKYGPVVRIDFGALRAGLWYLNHNN